MYLAFLACNRINNLRLSIVPFRMTVESLRTSTEWLALPEHTVLSYFPLFIFDVICRKSEMLRLARTSAITALAGLGHLICDIQDCFRVADITGQDHTKISLPG
jgi:hypothetical protein